MSTNEKKNKSYKKRGETIDMARTYSLADAIKALKAFDAAKFDETISLNFHLGIKPDQADQLVRGTVSLPNGSGKSVRVLCFAKGDAARGGEEAGADFVGAEELVEKVQSGWLDFDAVVAHPDMMREVSKVGRILGPRGLMPTPKTGTVTPQTGKSVKELKAGRVEFKSDKTAGVHVVCGKLSFSQEWLLENAQSVVRAIREAKPSTSKGEYLKDASIAPTMGPGINLVTSSL